MDDKIFELAEKVMTLAQNSVSVNLRFLQNAVVMLKTKTYGGTVATDGKHFFYNPVHILQAYKTNPNYPKRLFVHSLLHCIFRDWFVKKTVDSMLWDICCNITVESIINDLGICKIPQCAAQENILDILRRKVKSITASNLYEYFLFNTPSGKELAAIEEAFCLDDHSLWYSKKEDPGIGSDDEKSGNQNGKDSDNKDSGNTTGTNDKNDESQNGEGAGDNTDTKDQNAESQSGKDSDNKDSGNSTDTNDQNAESQSGEGAGDNPDNSTGTNGENSENDTESRRLEEYKAALAQKWQDLSEKIQMDLEAFSGKQMGGGDLLTLNLAKLNREKYDYTTFLREFSVLTEVMTVSEDEFDYNFYTYGMNMYGNMPLIEPLEYRDDNRVHDFVIAIDTSGSVRGKIVRAFVQKTYNILKQSESFSDRINVHIIQCDSKIQEDVKITLQEEFDKYIKNMTVKGFGGTDFRPVFSYVNGLIEKGEFNDLRGLIYLTDGYGSFPLVSPEYKTAFILWDDDCLQNVPQWAMSMVIGKDEI